MFWVFMNTSQILTLQERLKKLLKIVPKSSDQRASQSLPKLIHEIKNLQKAPLVGDKFKPLYARWTKVFEWSIPLIGVPMRFTGWRKDIMDNLTKLLKQYLEDVKGQIQDALDQLKVEELSRRAVTIQKMYRGFRARKNYARRLHNHYAPGGKGAETAIARLRSAEAAIARLRRA
jgi:hypothetical protein